MNEKKMVIKEKDIREKLIVENELKFELNSKKDFLLILNFLKKEYRITIYKTAELYDMYYDTDTKLLAKSEVSYRIRRRPQISINVKLPGTITDSIWSRYEYSCKVDKKVKENKYLFLVDCKIHKLLKKSFEINVEKDLCLVGAINTRRHGFVISKKEKNVFGNHEIIGIAFFDISIIFNTKKEMYEFEMESYEQSDVFVSPVIFEHFKKIGKYIKTLGFRQSKKTKHERCIVGDIHEN